jgi:hypothetical protein
MKVLAYGRIALLPAQIYVQSVVMSTITCLSLAVGHVPVDV